MSPLEINHAIAVARGWTRISPANDGTWTHPDGRSCGSPPNFYESLQAMHEAEDGLPSRLWQTYTQHLGNLTGTVRFCVAHASAAQRAEAYLKTIGQWEKTTPC